MIAWLTQESMYIKYTIAQSWSSNIVTQCAKSSLQSSRGLRMHGIIIWSQIPLMGSITYVLN
jgi:hypothetical protein